MSLNIQHFSELTQSQIDQAYNLIVQMVQEHDPTVDVKRGVVKDLVLYLSSVLSAANQANIDKVRRSNSLKAISADATLVDSDLVDRVASNYRVIRTAGTKAKGPVVVTLSTAKVLVISAGSKFITSDGLTFTTDDTYTTRLNQSDVISATDRLLYNLGTGLYSFVVNVTSSDVGQQYRLPVNTSLVPPFVDPAIRSSYTAADFTGGTDVETDTALSQRLQAGISNKSLANRPSIDGLIRSSSNFDESFATSTVGYGDLEMQRYHSILPIAFGGRADVYVRTNSTVINIQIYKLATLVSVNSSGQGVWQLSFGRDDAPGFYEVTRITSPANLNNLSSIGYAITSDVRSYDISTGSTAGTLFLPDLASGVEASYTRYQTASIQFVDTDTPTTGLTIGTATKQYGIQLRQLPGLSSVQDVISDRQSRYPVGDCLVKAPVPCFVSTTVFVGKRTVDAQPDIAAIQVAAAKAVNTQGFPGRIPASIVVAAIQSSLTTGTVTSLTLQGRVRRPNGTTLNLNSTTVLDVGFDPTNLVTNRTVGFFLDPADVTVVVTNIDSPSS